MLLPLDRDGFLVLVAALASVSCTGQRTPQTVQHVVVPVGKGAGGFPSAGAEGTAGAPGADEAVEVVAEDDCRNDLGEVNCDWAKGLPGPACEGEIGACELLPSTYQRRVAASICECLAPLGAQACSIDRKRKCIRQAFHEVCPDRRFNAPCAGIVAGCESPKGPADFSVQDCVEVLSSIADDGERNWAQEAMSTAHEGGRCKLMFPMY